MRAIKAIGLFGWGCVLVGCGSEPLRDESAVGSVSFELVNAPADARCARLTAVGADTTVTRTFFLAPAAPAVFTASGLPLGEVTLSEHVFTVDCDSVASSDPKWKSDQVDVELEAGKNVDVTFTLYEVGVDASVTVHTVFPEPLIPEPKPPVLSVGPLTNCVVLPDTRLKCWGQNDYAQLGLGDQQNRGDGPDEMGSNLPVVDVGSLRTAQATASGIRHTCAVLDDGSVKCWGWNDYGQLGLGDTTMRGDLPGEMGDNLPAVDLGTGRTALAIAAGSFQTCALLDDGSVKCWGNNAQGQLGIGDGSSHGGAPDTMGDNLPAVALGAGRTALAIAAGSDHTCALLDDHSIKCWGFNDTGQLGLGNQATRGDGPGEMGDHLPAVDLGTNRTALVITAGGAHSCAVLDDHRVKCWGYNTYGNLGLGDIDRHGDGPGEMGDNLPAVNLGTGKTGLAVSAGLQHTCALLHDNTVKCWGYNDFGQLGQGDQAWRANSPGQMGDALPSVNLGSNKKVLAVDAGDHHNCALFDDQSIKCWGMNSSGQLGLGSTFPLGVNAIEMGDNLPVLELD